MIDFENKVKLAQNGDIAARDEILNNYSNTIMMIIRKKYPNCEWKYNDLYDAGLEAVMNSIFTYTFPQSGRSFIAYTRDNIINAISRQYQSSLLFDDMDRLETYDENDYIASGLYYDFAEDQANSACYAYLRELIAQMPYVGRYIIVNHFCFDGNERLTLKNIAQNLNLPYSTIMSYYNRILNYISIRMHAKGYVAMTREESKIEYIYIRDGKISRVQASKNYHI